MLVPAVPTAAPDDRAEPHVFQRLRQLADGYITPLVAIAHRLPNVHPADRMVVLDHGWIVAEEDFAA